MFSAWTEFRKGKRGKKDVAVFEYNLEKNIFELRRELTGRAYRHGPYHGFYINDPKQRHIHKALVRDRLVHHAVFSVLNPIFERGFIYDSYSCRLSKGTHGGVARLAGILRRASRNNTRPCFALKCDIKKFFESVNHDILIDILKKRIEDEKTIWLLNVIIRSFPRGLPIGNLTSQLFANIYMNELDQFVKHKLRIPFYLRYTDDFVIVHHSQRDLEIWLGEIRSFLEKRLGLELHPHKVVLRKYHQGVDFLGYVQFPHYRILRSKTKRRILAKVRRGVSEEALQSYLGVLSHANAHKLAGRVKNDFWLNS